MKAYKMRAEAMIDAGGAIFELCVDGIVGDVQITRLHGHFGDVLVTFTFDGDLPVVINALQRVRDGHVMVRNVDHAAAFTGDNLRDETISGGVK